jgi:hypothetical protein
MKKNLITTPRVTSCHEVLRHLKATSDWQVQGTPAFFVINIDHLTAVSLLCYLIFPRAYFACGHFAWMLAPQAGCSIANIS